MLFLFQVPPLGGLNELSETPLKKEVNVDQQRQQGQQHSGAPIYLCTESGLGWARPPNSSNTSQDGSAGSGGSGGSGGGSGSTGGGEGDYMVLPRRTVSLKPPAPSSQGGGLGLGVEEKPLNITVEDPPFPPPPSPLTLHPAESEAYPADFVPSSVGDMNITMNLNRSYGTIKTMPHNHGHMMARGGLVHPHSGHLHSHGHSLQLKQGQRPSVRQILTGGSAVERTRTLPRNLGSTNANTSLSAGSLEVGKGEAQGVLALLPLFFNILPSFWFPKCTSLRLYQMQDILTNIIIITIFTKHIIIPLTPPSHHTLCNSENNCISNSSTETLSAWTGKVMGCVTISLFIYEVGQNGGLHIF